MTKRQKDQLIVFYDSWCPLCSKAKEKIEQVDRKERIRLISFRESRVFEKYKLHGKNVENRIYAVDEVSAKTFSGIHTILQIVKRIPKYRIMAPFVFLSIYLGLGQKMYDYIASKRNIVPVGHCNDQGCPIHRKDGEKHEE